MNKKTIQILSSIFPSFFAKKFYQRLIHPQIKKMRKMERDTIEKSEKEVLSINNNSIQLYKWGNGAKKILLVHGWEGQAGNFSYLIEKLLSNNYTIYSFDAPGHGNSSGGGNIMFEYLDTVDQIITKLGVRNIISHSFGSVVTTYSLTLIPNHVIDRYVLLTTPYTFKSYVENISGKIGISSKAIHLFYRKIEAERNVKIDELDISKYVQNINVEKALIIHDINDKVIQILDAEEVVKEWENAALLKISNTGHFKILRSPDVANKIIDFLDN